MDAKRIAERLKQEKEIASSAEKNELASTLAVKEIEIRELKDCLDKLIKGETCCASNCRQQDVAVDLHIVKAKAKEVEAELRRQIEELRSSKQEEERERQEVDRGLQKALVVTNKMCF